MGVLIFITYIVSFLLISYTLKKLEIRMDLGAFVIFLIPVVNVSFSVVLFLIFIGKKLESESVKDKIDEILNKIFMIGEDA